jgi:hypothetical protein
VRQLIKDKEDRELALREQDVALADIAYQPEPAPKSAYRIKVVETNKSTTTGKSLLGTSM